MGELKLSNLHVAHLSNEDAGSMFKLSYEMGERFQTEMGELLKASLTKIKKDNDPFVKQINKLAESELTDDVVAARKLCNTCFAEIKRTIVFESKSRDANKKDAALKLEFFLKPYWDITKTPLATQHELSTELCAKFSADTTIKEAASTIGIDTLIAEFETDNQNFGTIYKSRNEEISQRETSSSDLRPAASQSYHQFCNVLEQAVNLTPNPSLIKLFNNIDELRKKYHALRHNAKPKKGGE